MSSKLDLTEIKAQYEKADIEHKKWLAVMNHEKDHFLNSVATINFNACVTIKHRCVTEAGKIALELPR